MHSISNKSTAIVIGAGIAGIAIARALALKGYQVTVFERSGFAVGASVRNFGMVWPIGQPGKWYDTAIRSRDIWKSIGEEKYCWYRQTGSLHLAYHEDEWNVLNEVFSQFGGEKKFQLLNASEVMARSPAVIGKGLIGGLYSREETIVDPREAIAAAAKYLAEKFQVQFRWNECITSIKGNTINNAAGNSFSADLIIICSGADFETLYPTVFNSIPITKCKLQMMRFVSQNGWDIGPALSAGLSLIHYKSFAMAPSLQKLKERYEAGYPEYIKHGIHVMVSQNGAFELTVGDSHEYGLTLSAFDNQDINEMILKYLSTFVQIKIPKVLETWNGTYAKLTNGESYLFISPEQNVHVFNGLGGNGMTLSFGLAEELINTL